MRREALVGVVAAAVLPLLATASFSQTPAAAPVKKPPVSAGSISPQWKVQPAPPQVAPPPVVQPEITPPTSRGYSQFDELLEPREYPRVDPIYGNPPITADRQDNDYGLDSVPAYDATRPENPLGPY